MQLSDPLTVPEVRLPAGTLRMCAALHTHTSITSVWARAWQAGHQYTPAGSIAAPVTPDSASQAAIFCSDRQNVLKLLTITLRSPGAAPGSRTATQIPFLCTSIPATRGWTISIPASLPNPTTETGAPPAEPAARPESCNTRSQQQSGALTGQAPASIYQTGT